MEKYEIVTNIGKGSSGSVFLAKDVHTRRLVAIKRIEIDENRKSRCKKSVIREASILRRLSHPHIVECEGWFLDEREEVINIIIEYCNGGTMQDMVHQTRMKKTYFPEEKVMKWMAEIVSAVAYMHSKRILHRDLKTENVFVVKPDVAKLGDFGISKEIDHTLDMAQTCVGTPCYLSPELCQDIPYSSKSDVWALGCLLFEMAALKPAFDASNLVSLFYKIVKGDYASLPEHFSKNLQELVKCILQKAPDDRPTALKLLEHPALKKYTNHLSVESLPQKFLRKSASVNEEVMWDRKKPPKLAELRHKSKNVEEFSSFENSDTITNDTDRTLSPGPSYAYNMFLSGIKENSKSVTKEISISNKKQNRSVSVLETANRDAMRPSRAVPKLFAYQAQMNIGTDSPPPQEVETARPQTCPDSASRTRTQHFEGFADGSDKYRLSDNVSLSSGTDESSDGDHSILQHRKENVRRKKRGRVRSNGYSSDSSSDESLPRNYCKDTHRDDDIPEIIESQGEEFSGDSANTGDEQNPGDKGRILPGSAWLRARRDQVFQQHDNILGSSSNNKKTKNDKKVRVPGSSWLSKDLRDLRDQVVGDRTSNEDVILGENNHSDHSPRRGKESKRVITKSGNIRNLPGSAWLRNSPNKSETYLEASPRNHITLLNKKQPSLVLESYSSGNGYSSSDRKDSDTDAEYYSDLSYPDDFEDYEDDFEYSDDEIEVSNDKVKHAKSSLDVVRQGCKDLLGEKTFEDLVLNVEKGLSLSQAKKKFGNKVIDSETLETCYMLLQK